jgi:hypothetical protein
MSIISFNPTENLSPLQFNAWIAVRIQFMASLKKVSSDFGETVLDE